MRVMDVLISTHSIHYNGVRAKQIKEARGKFTLQPKESRWTPNLQLFKLYKYRGHVDPDREARGVHGQTGGVLHGESVQHDPCS